MNEDLQLEAQQLRRTRKMAALLVIALFFAIIYHSALHAFGLRYPFDTFLFDPSDRGKDWFNPVSLASSFDPYFVNKLATANYFPFAYVAFLAGYGLPKIVSFAGYLIFSAALLCGGVLFSLKYLFLPSCNVAKSLRILPQPVEILTPLLFIAFFNYPVIFGVDRGNIDVWIGALLLIYVAPTISKKWSWCAPLALGIAIALKGFPLAFILLGLQNRKYIESLCAILIAATLTIFGFAVFNGGVIHNLHGIMNGQNQYNQLYVLGTASMHFSSDPYNALRSFGPTALHLIKKMLSFREVISVFSIHSHIPDDSFTIATNKSIIALYTTCSFVAACLSSFFVLFAPIRAWKRVMIVTIVAILFPIVANDYKLSLLLPATIVLLADWDTDPAQRKVFWILFFLLIPKNYIYYQGLSLQMIINSALLLALWIICILPLEPWRICLINFLNSTSRLMPMRILARPWQPFWTARRADLG